ncbi:hypothetical protein SNE25_06755 [Mucilaginibacter sabulilitoris]|uniref:AprE-like beta-barrel domain-containing protein n=1 Tax=Mucilaginibacter sabulilitoris TaxID=1173583 RepID=A0ABZ0TQ16_9SPHI|nr:hypothetical protein [Mucilaginibacter sabulilitoris]WPU95222.1 hypothetical protein SNE25_06755 [Mucilaginibacter sabulilitoris]
MVEEIQTLPKKKEKKSRAGKIVDNFEQRSEAAQDIISSKPDFFEKYALLCILGTLLILVGSTWFIRYPDFIEARATLTANSAPKELVPKTSGRLVRLFVRNNQQLQKDDIIGWIESTADHKEVMELSNEINSSIAFINHDQPEKVFDIFQKYYNNLGEIQIAYQQFINAWQQFNDYTVNGFYFMKRSLLENDITSIDKTQVIIEGQKKLTEQDIKLAEETYKMNKTLLDQNVLTKEEFRSQTSKYVNKQLAIPQLKTSLLTNQTQKRDKLRELGQLNHDIAQQKVIFEQALQSLKSKVDDWITKYIIKAPISGKVSFTIPLQENQYLQFEKTIGYINPADTHYYAEAYLSQYNFGKIDTGLTVQLRFDAYPYQELGFVEGKINYISNVPSDSGFLATIKFNKGLVTNNNRNIAYKSGLKAQAIVITKDMRLLQRLYYNMVKSASAGK